MAKGAHPLTQQLAFLDLATLAAHDQGRRVTLYARERGAAWPRLLKLLLRPLDETASALEATRKRRGAAAQLPAGLGSRHMRLVPGPILFRAHAAHFAITEHAARAGILSAAPLVIAAADATSCLIGAATSEDALDSVHLAASLGIALTSLLRCLQALESYMAGTVLVAGGRSRTPSNRSQQSLVLRVALGPPAQARAPTAHSPPHPLRLRLSLRLTRPLRLTLYAAGAQVRATGAHCAAAMENALSRAIYLLVHSYGQRAVMASGVAAELRPRLEPFCAELF